MGDSSVIIDKPENHYSSLDMVEYYKYYKKFETNVMYYLGKQSICFMLSKVPIPDISSNVYGDFYSYISAIKTCFKNKEFDKLPEVRKKLWHKYLSKFPNNFHDELYPII